MKAEIIKKIKFAQPSPLQLRKMFKAVVGGLLGKKSGLGAKARRRLKGTPQILLVFVDSAEMRELNKKFRGKKGPTDVLSFAPVDKYASLGELVFCLPVLKAQAREQGLTLRDEFLYLLIHGILHLLGYDHETNDKAARQMYRLQDDLFNSLRQS